MSAPAKKKIVAPRAKTTNWDAAEIQRRYAELVGDENDPSSSAKKRRRILRAAYDLFLAHGYRRTSIDDVARKAEVAKGTVYLYFPNKGALLVAAVAYEKLKLKAQTMKLVDGTIPKGQRLHYWLELALTCARDLPLAARLMSGDNELIVALEEIGHDEMQTRMSEGVDFVETLVEEVAPHLDPETRRLRAESIISLSFLSTKLLEFTHGRPIDQLASTIADMIVHGVGHPKD